MKPVAETLGVSRPHLSATSRGAPRQRAAYKREGDDALLDRIRAIVRERPSYGYRRVTARLNREGERVVNHKRVYRLMKQAQLLLPKYGVRPERLHDGKIVTLASDLRWCADRHLDGSDIRDLMAQSVEARFGGTHTPHPVEWLSDNGPPYTANETRSFGALSGLLVRNTPAYSPESNGMSEGFVKTFKRDYVYFGDVDSARAVLLALPAWFADYNENHPHKGLNMLSPRQFRRVQST